MSPFDASGHLSELSLDRLHLDPPEADLDFVAAAAPHLASCGQCRDALSARAADDAAFRLTPPPAVVVPLAHRARGRSRLVAGAGVALALAAGLVVATRPGAPPDATLESGRGVTEPPPGDGLRKKGGAIDLTVHLHDGTKSRLGVEGEAVHAGDRAGFELVVREAGFVAVVGWDASDRVYAVWPTGSPLAAVRAAAIAPATEPQALPGAVRFDATPGEEHLAAVYCRDAFTLGEVVPGEARGSALLAALRQDGASASDGPHGGCVVRHVAFVKATEPGAP